MFIFCIFNCRDFADVKPDGSCVFKKWYRKLNHLTSGITQFQGNKKRLNVRSNNKEMIEENFLRKGEIRDSFIEDVH